MATFFGYIFTLVIFISSHNILGRTAVGECCVHTPIYHLSSAVMYGPVDSANLLEGVISLSEQVLLLPFLIMLTVFILMSHYPSPCFVVYMTTVELSWPISILLKCTGSVRSV